MSVYMHKRSGKRGQSKEWKHIRMDQNVINLLKPEAELREMSMADLLETIVVEWHAELQGQ
jgi:hypothetical protein